MDASRATAEILIVEDDVAILSALSYNLTRKGFSVQQAKDAKQALRLAHSTTPPHRRPDLILLDLMLPGGQSGVEVCQRIREEDQQVVVIMLTAKDAEEDKVRGLEAGADDYVTKPFGMNELVARINANLKRTSSSTSASSSSSTGSNTSSSAATSSFSRGRGGGRVIEAGELRLDTKNYEARMRGEVVGLRLKEFELLLALARREGDLVSREELAKEVWGHERVGSTSRTIDVHVRRIRAALAAASANKQQQSSSSSSDSGEGHEYVHTVRGLGYRFQAPPGEDTLSSDGEDASSTAGRVAERG